jgi:hypothetical protein
MANPVCERCEEMGHTSQTEEVHHKIPWETGVTEEDKWKLFTDWNNLMSVCIPCHHELDREYKNYKVS